VTTFRISLLPPARERWTAIGLVTLIALLAYGPLVPWLGFYRDDWYQIWAGTTLGPRSIITLFSIDRPVMGYTYAATFYFLRDSALAWQLYALLLRWLGALGALWLFRKLWPGQPFVTTSAASRLYAAHRLSKKITISPREWRGMIIGLTLMVVPIVLFCLATIASLRTEEARRAFGIH